jgi:hypothetical protein
MGKLDGSNSYLMTPKVVAKVRPLHAPTTDPEVLSILVQAPLFKNSPFVCRVRGLNHPIATSVRAAAYSFAVRSLTARKASHLALIGGHVCIARQIIWHQIASIYYEHEGVRYYTPGNPKRSSDIVQRYLNKPNHAGIITTIDVVDKQMLPVDTNRTDEVSQRYELCGMTFNINAYIGSGTGTNQLATGVWDMNRYLKENTPEFMLLCHSLYYIEPVEILVALRRGIRVISVHHPVQLLTRENYVYTFHELTFELKDTQITSHISGQTYTHSNMGWLRKGAFTYQGVSMAWKGSSVGNQCFTEVIEFVLSKFSRPAKSIVPGHVACDLPIYRLRFMQNLIQWQNNWLTRLVANSFGIKEHKQVFVPVSLIAAINRRLSAASFSISSQRVAFLQNEASKDQINAALHMFVKNQQPNAHVNAWSHYESTPKPPQPTCGWIGWVGGAALIYAAYKLGLLNTIKKMFAGLFKHAGNILNLSLVSSDTWFGKLLVCVVEDLICDTPLSSVFFGLFEGFVQNMKNTPAEDEVMMFNLTYYPLAHVALSLLPMPYRTLAHYMYNAIVAKIGIKPLCISQLILPVLMLVLKYVYRALRVKPKVHEFHGYPNVAPDLACQGCVRVPAIEHPPKISGRQLDPTFGLSCVQARTSFYKQKWFYIFGYYCPNVMITMFQPTQRALYHAYIERLCYQKPEIAEIKVNKYERLFMESLPYVPVDVQLWIRKQPTVKQSIYSAMLSGDFSQMQPNLGKRMGFAKFEKALGILDGKVKPHNVRLIHAGGHYENFLVGPTIMSIQAALHEYTMNNCSNLKCISTCGMRFEEIGYLISHVLVTGRNHTLCLDKSAFDGSLTRPMAEFEQRLYEVYLGHHFPELKIQWEPSVLCRGGIKVKNLGYCRKSGDPNTTLGNTLLCMFTMQRSLHAIGLTDCVVMCAGDDGLIFSPVPWTTALVKSFQHHQYATFGLTNKCKLARHPAQIDYISARPIMVNNDTNYYPFKGLPRYPQHLKLIPTYKCLLKLCASPIEAARTSPIATLSTITEAVKFLYEGDPYATAFLSLFDITGKRLKIDAKTFTGHFYTTEYSQRCYSPTIDRDAYDIIRYGISHRDWWVSIMAMTLEHLSLGLNVFPIVEPPGARCDFDPKPDF